MKISWQFYLELKSRQNQDVWPNCKAIHLVFWKEVFMKISWQFYLELRSRSKNQVFLAKL